MATPSHKARADASRLKPTWRKGQGRAASSRNGASLWAGPSSSSSSRQAQRQAGRQPPRLVMQAAGKLGANKVTGQVKGSRGGGAVRPT